MSTYTTTNQKNNYQIFFDALTDGAIIGSFLTQQIVDANRSLSILSGYTLQELRSLMVDDLLVNQSHYVLGDSVGENLAEGYLRKKDGEIVLVEMSGMMIEETKGAFALIVRDITKQRTKLKTLQSRQDLLTVVSNISNKFMNIKHDEIDMAIQNVLMEIADFSGSSKIYLYEYTDSTLRQLRNGFYWPAQNDGGIDLFSRFSGKSYDFLIHKLEKKRPFILNRQDINLQTLDLFLNEFDHQDIKSIAIIPINYEDELVGLMGLEVVQENYEWGIANINLYHLIGELLINALIHKRHDETMVRNEKNYRDLIYGSPLAIMVMCSNKILLINNLVKKLFGLETDQSILEFYKFIDSNVREFVINKVNYVCSQFIGTRENFELNCKNINDHDIVIDLIIQKIDYDCGPAVIFMLDDITEQKQLEKQRKENQRFSLALDQITRLAASAQDKKKTLQMIADSLGSILGADGCYISLWDNEKNVPIPAAAYGPFRNTYPSIQKANNEPTVTEAVLLNGKTLVVEDTSNHPSLSKRIAGMFPSKSLIGIPLIVEKKKLGAALISFNDYHKFSKNEILRAESLVGPLVLAFMKAQSHEDLAAAYEETLIGWANAIEVREKAARGHSLRVAKASVELGRMIGLNEDELKILRWGAFLHDIGKMGIPDEILLKPGILTDSEMEVMRTHSYLGYRILKPIKFLKEAINVPFHHHERWDGNGYPNSLKGKDIPLNARIFSIVDVWDALATSRPYKSAWEIDQIKNYLHQNAGIQFDPELVPIFIKLVNAFDQEWSENIQKEDFVNQLN